MASNTSRTMIAAFQVSGPAREEHVRRRRRNSRRKPVERGLNR